MKHTPVMRQESRAMRPCWLAYVGLNIVFHFVYYQPFGRQLTSAWRFFRNQRHDSLPFAELLHSFSPRPIPLRCFILLGH